MRLPSGRCLWYRRARVGTKVWPDGGTSPQLEYYGVENKHVGWCSTYGGKLVENATQAISRDVFMAGVLAAEDEGWPIVLRVHDEMGAELPSSDPRDHRDLCEVMTRKLAWCPDLPLDAEGWTGQFYRKD
jgi:DNA polymerase